jgi:cation:H+ antiporter
LVAILFALRLRGSVGIGTLISSKVNQWTLLVGAIPIVYAISAGGWAGLPLDDRQTEELVLTSTQSVLATILIADMQFSRRDAIVLALLFVGQFAFTSTHVRYLFIGLYVVISVGMLIAGGSERRAMFFSLIWSRSKDAGGRPA